VRILIIDNSRQFMGSIRRQLAVGLPDVEVTEYDSEERGMPDGQFDWSLYDVLIITYELGESDAGYLWLRDLITMPGLPPTLVIARQLDVYGAVAVMRAGAADILLREDIETQALVERAARLSKQRVAPLGDTESDLIVTDAMATESGRTQTSAWVGEHEYLFMRLIGQGGMARAYLTQRHNDGQLMVVKTIAGERLADKMTRDRFLSEAQLAMSVNHDHVVEIVDVGFTDDFGMMAMEFFPRGDLKGRIENGLDESVALKYLRQIALGIDAIWQTGIVHRDLKPGNLMFRSDDSLALADFGIAKRLEDGRTDTTFGRVLGTPAYFSPEQARGVAIDTRSDIYSTGVIFFEMLTGGRPYDVPTIESMIYHHVHADVPPLPRPLRRYQELIDRMLAKRPQDRYVDATALVAAVDAG
jgi:tRNA A-37 threonylcarbamoyl transferase component Bud32